VDLNGKSLLLCSKGCLTATQRAKMPSGTVTKKLYLAFFIYNYPKITTN
jgi:hypothetical protein